MPKPWDDNMKRLIRANPQHFVTWILKGAIYKDALSIELKNVTREADFLLDVEYESVPLLMQFEVQSYKDDDMALRLLEYNVLATREHGRPVLPCLIYLRKDGRVVESPLIWQAPIGHEVLRFHFIVVKLWEMKAEELIQTGLTGLLPLVPLTKNGGEYEVVDKVAAELAEANEYNLLEYARRFASLVFKGAADLEWLNRRFAMYRDILEDSWVVQEERREGEVRGLRRAVLNVIQARFPEIHSYAKKHIEVLEDTETLQRLNLKMSTAASEEEALQYLIALVEEEKRTDTDHGEPTVSD